MAIAFPGSRVLILQDQEPQDSHCFLSKAPQNLPGRTKGRRVEIIGRRKGKREKKERNKKKIERKKEKKRRKEKKEK
jgi:hypothetical protein